MVTGPGMNSYIVYNEAWLLCIFCLYIVAFNTPLQFIASIQSGGVQNILHLCFINIVLYYIKHIWTAFIDSLESLDFALSNISIGVIFT